MHKFEGECDERLCGKNIYIERTNRSFHSFHSIAFSENKEGGRKQRLRTGTNSIKKKKKIR